MALSATDSAAEIVFDRATKRYPGRPQPAVSELSLTIPAGDICVLVGPSGGGKTTAMKMVNRLISITEGDIRINGTSVRSLDLTDLRRGIGYVIQQVGLFPHLSVGAWTPARVSTGAQSSSSAAPGPPYHERPSSASASSSSR